MKHIITILFCLPLIASSQSLPVALADEPGTWTYAYLNDANTKMYAQKYGMTAPELAAFKVKLDRLVEIIHRNPVMANPRGFNAVVESRPYYPYDFKKYVENYGYVGEMNFRLPQYFLSDGRKYVQNIEPPRTTIYFNDIVLLRHAAFGVVAGENNKNEAALVNDICKPMVIKELAPGVTLYDYAIVFTKPERKLYLPCTVGEAYNRLIAYYQSAIKEEPYYSYLFQPIDEEYKKLSPEQLKMPAFFGGPSGVTYIPSADTLMLFNNNFFDRTKPKTAVQAIIIPINSDYFRKAGDFVPSDVGYKRIWELHHSLDIEAVSAMIE